MTYQKLLQDYDLSKKVSWKKTKKSAKKKVDGTMKKRKKVQKIKHDVLTRLSKMKYEAFLMLKFMLIMITMKKIRSQDLDNDDYEEDKVTGFR